MASSKKQRLEQAVSFLQGRYGARVVDAGKSQAERVPPPSIPTSFASLDAILGCGGLPLGAITLLTGRTTSGKLTLAYKALAQAQRVLVSRRTPQHAPVAILDLTHSSDPDYLVRCGVSLEDLLLVRPQSGQQALNLVIDALRGRLPPSSYPLRMILADSVANLTADRAGVHYFDALLPQLNMLLARAACAMVFLDEPRAPWLYGSNLPKWLGGNNLPNMRSNAIAHFAALHIELKREIWSERGGELYGYRAQAQLIKSRWARSSRTATIEIRFNGMSADYGRVKARSTW